MQPLVTIIVPIYNSELFIKECVEKLLAQTYSNLQIVLVDDGSKDHSYQICASFLDERITLVQKENGGASSARNLGLDYAKGDYIYFADSDDYLDTDAVEVLVKAVQESHADCVYFEADNYTDEEGLTVKEKGFSQKTDYKETEGNKLIRELLKNKDYHAAPFLYFVHRSIYDRGIRFEEGIMMEDELFSFELLRACKKVVCLRQELYHRRLRAGSVMTSTGKEQYRFDSISRVFACLLTSYQKNDETLAFYLKRIGLLWFGYWRAMSKTQKSENKQKYTDLRNRILREKGFGSLELIVRCFGYYLWLGYIIPGRCVRKIRLRRLQ